jgi:hypothetical protein
MPTHACAQVAREGFVVFFSETFDALFRLCADNDTNVQNAVQFLDNLVKVCVCVCVLSWVAGVRGVCHAFVYACACPSTPPPCTQTTRFPTSHHAPRRTLSRPRRTSAWRASSRGCATTCV